MEHVAVIPLISGRTHPSRVASWGTIGWGIIGVLGAVIGVAWLVPRVLVVLVPVVAAALVAGVLGPIVARLRRLGLPPLASVWATFLGSTAIVIGAVLLLVSIVSNEFAALRGSLSGGVGDIETWLVDGPLQRRAVEYTAGPTRRRRSDTHRRPELLLPQGR